MSNPFQNASLPELLAMIPDLSDAELDALTAIYCEGWDGSKHLGSRKFRLFNSFTGEHEEVACPIYTSDWREAGRLLVKYRLTLMPLRDEWGVLGHPSKPMLAEASSPCRAIAEAACVAELTQRIEGVAEKQVP